MDAVSNNATTYPASGRPLLRRKPGLRCLKIAAASQARTSTTVQLGGKTARLPKITDEGGANGTDPAIQGEAASQVDGTAPARNGAPNDADNVAQENEQRPPQPVTSHLPGWYAGAGYRRPAIMWPAGMITACPTGIFPPHETDRDQFHVPYAVMFFFHHG